MAVTVNLVAGLAGVWIETCYCCCSCSCCSCSCCWCWVDCDSSSRSTLSLPLNSYFFPLLVLVYCTVYVMDGVLHTR